MFKNQTDAVESNRIKDGHEEQKARMTQAALIAAFCNQNVHYSRIVSLPKFSNGDCVLKEAEKAIVKSLEEEKKMKQEKHF